MEQQEVCAAVEQYGSTVYRLALAQTHSQADADDVYQEVFLRYVRAAPAFATEEHRKAWLLRVTINCCKKLQGSFWRKHTVALSEAIPARTEGEGELLELLEALPEMQFVVWHASEQEQDSLARLAMTHMESFIGKVCWNGERKQIYWYLPSYLRG